MVFIHGISMCEGVGEDSRHGIGHLVIRVGIMSSLECVCLPLHEYLGGEQPLLEVITIGLCLPHRGIPLSGTGSIPDDDAH